MSGGAGREATALHLEADDVGGYGVRDEWDEPVASRERAGIYSSAAAAATCCANQDRNASDTCAGSSVGLTAPSAKSGGRTGAAAAGSSRRRPIPVGSFVDQAFSLNLPGSIRLVSVPAGALDDADYDDDYGDEDDATAPFLTSYYPLIPLLLSLCLPVAVLYQHYSRSCLDYFDPSCLDYFDPAAETSASASDSNSASASDSNSASDLGGDVHVPAEAEAAAALHAPPSSSMLQKAVHHNGLQMLLAFALFVYAPTLRVHTDRLLRRMDRTPAGRAVKATTRRILAVCGRLLMLRTTNPDHPQDDAAADGCPPHQLAMTAAPSASFLEEVTSAYQMACRSSGPHRERTASGSSLPGGSRSSPTGHIVALKALAALTLVLLAAHPDGCLWYLLAVLREGMGSVGDLLVLIGEGGLPGLVGAGVLLTSLVLARQIRRVLIPPDKSAEAADSSSGGKLGKGRSKKGKKGKGRGSGRGRIRHQQSRNAHHHHQHHQYNDNLHEAAPHHGSIHPFQSSTSSHMSVSSLEEQTTGEPSSELQSKSAKKKKKKRGGGGGKKLQAAGPSSPTLAPPTPQTPRHQATTRSRYSAGNHDEATSRHQGGEGGTTPQPSSGTVPSTRSSTKKEHFTPSRENKGPEDRHEKSNTSLVDRDRNCNHPGSPAAGVGNYRPAIADPCSNEKAEQSQTSFANVREGRRSQEFVDPWQARVQDTSMSERGSSQLGPTDGIDNAQSNLNGTTVVDREFSISSPGGPPRTMLRPPPGLAPLLDTVRYSGNDESTHQGNTLPPIGYESSSIGGNVLLALEPGRTVLGNPFLQTDHTDGLLSPAPMSDPARTRRLSGDDMIDFRVGISASAAIPSLPPLPQSNLGVGLSGTALTGLTADNNHVGGLSIGLGVGSHLITGMDDDDKIEADLQELGGQMVGSVLD